MFRKEIKFIYDFNLNKVRKLGSYLTYDQIKNANIHPAILHYISAEIDYLIFEDRQKILKDSIFDYSGEIISGYFNKIAGEVKKNKRFSIEFIAQLILHSSSFTVNYLARPRWALMKLIFEDELHKSTTEIKQILNYVYYYGYLKKIITSYINRKKILSLNYDEFEDLLNRIDNAGLQSGIDSILDASLVAMSDFFNHGETNKQLIPVQSVEMFLREKNLTAHLQKLNKIFPQDEKLVFEISDFRKAFSNIELVDDKKHDEPDEEEPAVEDEVQAADEETHVDNEDVNGSAHLLDYERNGINIKIAPDDEPSDNAEPDIDEQTEHQQAEPAVDNDITGELFTQEDSSEIKKVSYEDVAEEIIVSKPDDLIEEPVDIIEEEQPEVEENDKMDSSESDENFDDVVTHSYTEEIEETETDEPQEIPEVENFQEEEAPDIDEEVTGIETPEQDSPIEEPIENEAQQEQIEDEKEEVIEFNETHLEEESDFEEFILDEETVDSEPAETSEIVDEEIEKESVEEQIETVDDNENEIESLIVNQEENDIEGLDSLVYDSDCDSEENDLEEEPVEEEIKPAEPEELSDEPVQQTEEIIVPSDETELPEEPEEVIEPVGTEEQEEAGTEDFEIQPTLFGEDDYQTVEEPDIETQTEPESIETEQEESFETISEETQPDENEYYFAEELNDEEDIEEIELEEETEPAPRADEIPRLSDDVDIVRDSHPLSENSKFEISELLERKNMTKVIDVIFDYDIEEFANVIDRACNSANSQEAEKVLEDLFTQNHISSSSKEAETLKDVIADYFSRKEN